VKTKLILLLLLFTGVAFAGDREQLRFVSFNSIDGLPASETHCVFTDRNGFVWIGTSNGLARFDGHEFRVYKHRRNDSNSLPDNAVYSIEGYGRTGLLLGTAKGIAFFEPQDEKFRLLQNKDEGADVSGKTFTDRSGTTWAWSLGTLKRLNARTMQLEEVLHCDGKNGNPDRIKAFYSDSHGRCWIGSFDGLYAFDPATKKRQHIVLAGEPAAYLVNCIFEDHTGTIWCGGWGTAFLQLDEKNNTLTSTRWDINPVNPSATNIVHAFAETRNGNSYQLWAATSNGLAALQKTTSGCTFTFHNHNEAQRESICSDDLRSLGVNANGELWICTGNGIAALLPGLQQFKPYLDKLQGDVIRLVPDGEQLFACTWYGNGLQLADKSGNIVRSWNHVPENTNALPNMQISDVLRADDGSLWVCGFGGLAHGDASGKIFQQLPVIPDDPFALSTGKMTSIAEDHDGNIWCGTYSHGVEVLLKRENIVTHFSGSGKGTDQLPHSLVWDLLPDANRRMWIATNDGIAFYDPASKQITAYRKVRIGNDSIPLGICYRLFFDHRQTLWIATENGLFARNTAGSFLRYDEENGLSGNEIGGIAEDAKGNVWVSTSGGLSAIAPNDTAIRNFTMASGLPYYATVSELLFMSGKIIAGNHNGGWSFDPDKLFPPQQAPGVLLTAFTAGDVQRRGIISPEMENNRELNWKQNTVSFEFISPGLAYYPAVRYEYRLAGVTAWISSGQQHTVSFAGLSPGTYTFEVRTMINGKRGNSNHYRFIITPPFWQTWWFITLAVLSAALLLVFIVRRESTRRIREKLLRLEKQQAIEQERNRISQDMHDDLGSGLTRIAILSEVVRRKMNSPGEAGPHIDSISAAARNLVDSLNEIIWSLNPDNDKLENLLAYLREYAGRFLEPAGITLHTAFGEEPEHIMLTEEQRRFIFLVVKEALHNIVKHAGATEVQLHVTYEPELLQVQVIDNGRGFSPDEKAGSGNGLANMQLRMKKIGANYSIRSAPGKGTTITLRIPLLKIT
jgi:signal transduction histidine kinase/ligand-binding sensor domain-containing protein